MKFTKEQIACHDAWRKALRDGRVDMTFKSVSDARRIRFALYNSVRPIREGKVADPELAQAAEECSISLDGATLTILAKVSSDSMQVLLGAIGKSAEDLTPQALPEAAPAEAEESLRRLLARPEFADVVPQQVSPDRPRLDYTTARARAKGSE